MRRAKPASSGDVEVVKVKAPQTQPTGQRIKALVIQAQESLSNYTGQSNVNLEDAELESFTKAGRVIEPPYDPLVLLSFLENSTILEQCIAALEININGFGYKLPRRVQVDHPDVTDELKRAVMEEEVLLENYFANICIDYPFLQFRRMQRRDYDTTGNAYYEVVRNGKGQPVQFTHIPCYQMRLTPLDKNKTEFTQKRLMRRVDGSVDVTDVKQEKRFRRYVQFARLGASGVIRRTYGKPLYFKEFGDPRPIDSATGDPLARNQIKGHKLATEVVHRALYAARTPYGIPRYIGNLITLLGDREADTVNFVTLKNNNVPSMVVAVSNGALTQPSIDRMKQYVAEQIAGPNRSRFLILEAESPFQQESEGTAPKIVITPLTNSQMQDQLFQALSDNNRKKVLESFRLPPIFVGRSETYNRATAESSRRLADEQIFNPERTLEDYWYNHRLFPELDIKYHRFLTLGPNVTDDEDLIKVLIAAEKTGGMTPRIARRIIEDIMGQEFTEAWKDMDPDVPLTLQLAERVKNTAAVSVATQSAPIGVEAMLKALGDDEMETLRVLARFAELRASLEKRVDEVS